MGRKIVEEEWKGRVMNRNEADDVRVKGKEVRGWCTCWEGRKGRKMRLRGWEWGGGERPAHGFTRRVRWHGEEHTTPCLLPLAMILRDSASAAL